MMISEFIERTGFEPTAAEYREIEAEYMGGSSDKDKFCKEWKKNGGPERLMRLRAYRIEELEREIVKKDKLFEDRTNADTIRYRELFEKSRSQIDALEAKIRTMEENANTMSVRVLKAEAKEAEAERKLAVLREAFEILGIKKED